MAAEKYKDFIKENVSKEEFDKFRFNQRKIVKKFVNANIINKYDSKYTLKLVSVKPYLEYTEVIFRAESKSFYNSKRTRIKEYKKAAINLNYAIEDLEKIFIDLGLSPDENVNVHNIGKSFSFEAILIIPKDYIESNLFNSIENINKYNL